MTNLAKFEQEAFDRLRKTLNFTESVDLLQVIYNADTRIRRTQEELAEALERGDELEKQLAKKQAENTRLKAISLELLDCGDPKPWKIKEWVDLKNVVKGATDRLR